MQARKLLYRPWFLLVTFSVLFNSTSPLKIDNSCVTHFCLVGATLDCSSTGLQPDAFMRRGLTIEQRICSPWWILLTRRRPQHAVLSSLTRARQVGSDSLSAERRL